MVTKRKITVGNSVGLHARPAARFVMLAKRFQGAVVVTYGEKKANGKSMLELLKLGVRPGDEIDVELRPYNKKDQSQEYQFIYEFTSIVNHEPWKE
jgi:phosphotransferase system HPr (HPr) family protein